MSAPLHTRILEILTKYDGEILGEWVDQQFRALTLRRDLMRDEDLRDQSQRFLEQFRHSLDKGALERSVEAVRLRFDGQPVPRPPHWGGYRLTPTLIEFWLPHAHRLNERLEFRRDGAGWVRQALAP